jgi:hypothetical protein
MSDDVVKVAEAENEMEASLICGFLESQGIRATYDKGNVGQFPSWQVDNLPFSGRQEIVVRAHDAERAAQLLAERQR